MFTSVLLVLFATGTTLLAQDWQKESLGLPGDNLNLFAVMKLFQASETLEGFERNLNDENSRINNLDLNGDNIVDYIKVIDYVDGDVHTIVLQVAVNENENQDVAVFTVQRDNNGQVQIQLTGDEALYGRNYIIEPIYDDVNIGQTPNPGYSGNSRRVNNRNINVNRTTMVEIAAWPIVRFIYMPSYSGWRSSWYYGYYPSYWHPWQPFYWDYYYGYHYNWYNDYYAHYRHSDYHRYTRWNDFYYSGRRSYSPNVNVRIQAGNYKTTYSHPDQRREGEALFTKLYPEQSTRRSDNSSGNSNGRRSGSQSTQQRQSDGTGTGSARRSGNTVNNRSDSRRSSGQNAGSTRRTTTNAASKSDSRPTSGQNAGSTRRTTTNAASNSESRSTSGQNAVSDKTRQTNAINKSVSKPTSVQNRGTNRRTSTNAANNSASKPPQQNARSTRRSSSGAMNKSDSQPASTKSTTTRVRSSSRRNSDNSTSGTTVRQGEKSKETEAAKTTRRK